MIYPWPELLMGWLDIAHLGVGGLDVREVLGSVSWRFKGGRLGAYEMKFPTEHSGSVFPDRLSDEISALGDDDVNYVALMTLLRNRARDRPKRARACADWLSSYRAGAVLRSDCGSSELMRTGLSAVYLALSHIWENCSVPPRSTSLQRLRSYVRETTLASATASFHDVPTVAALVDSTFSALSFTRLAAIRHATTEFKTMLRYTGSREARSAAVSIGRQLMDDPSSWADATIRECGGVKHEIAGRSFFAVHGCAFVVIGSRVLALSRSDLVRVHQFLIGVQSGLFATVSQACIAPGPERARATEIAGVYEAQVALLLEGARRVPIGDEVMVCKAFKRAFGAYIGEISGPLCANETRELWAEALSTKHAGVLRLGEWVANIRPWTASTAFNLGKVYKLCPAPDASPGLTLIERHEMICNHNVANPGILADFTTELRSQILRAYIRKPGVSLEPRGARPTWWGAYKAGRFDEVPSDEISEFLQWEGTASMPPRSADNPAVWKDSGLGWDTFEEAVNPARNQKHGNMLTRMVFDSDIPMPGVRHFGHVTDQKVDIKPEGHKDPARGIYSGNIHDRLNQSWMEAAVHDVAVNHPAFMIGADSATRDARVRLIVDRPHDPDLVALFYSFDVSGWSPRMPPEVQHISHTIWALLYAEILFRNAHLITDGSRIYMNKGGYMGWYKNPGTNLEGYNGKEMTMLLITLMSLTVKRWRAMLVEEGLATEVEVRKWSAVLLAFIDDGLSKLVLPRDRAEVLFDRFKTCSVSTFSACGFTIEMSKCYPSDSFAVFLNEPYLAGRHVTHGTRAAMTICAENTEEHTSIIERLTAVSTGCRGAVMAGLDATSGVMLQSFHAHAHIEEWVRRPDPVLAAVWSMMPRAWGGLGLPTALQLGTSGSGSAFEESVRTMQRWASISTSARVAFLKRAKQQLVNRTPTGILLAPLGGRVSDGSIVETRVPDAVRAALTHLRTDMRLSRLANDFLAYSSPKSLDSYSAAVVPLKSGEVIQEQLLSDLSSAHPHSIFSSFAKRIEKSTTLMQLVGQRELSRIIRENRRDAAESYRCVKALLMV